MGQQLKRRPRPALRRAAVVALLGALVLLAGCSAETQHQWENLAMPDPATEQAEHIFYLWRYGLDRRARHRRHRLGPDLLGRGPLPPQSDDEIPVQTRYNLPLEIFYTIAPIIMVIVFFYHTVNVQNAVLDDTEQDYTIDVVGQQWSWTFNHILDGQTEGPVVYTAGTGSNIPTLMLPVGKTVEFRLNSPDVIHSFGIPGFLMRMDTVPGRVNHYEVTPETEGTFAGKCFELCGTSHSRMLFNVEVVSESEYLAYLDELEAQGNYSEESVLGGNYANEQVGLDQEEESE